MKHPNDDTKSTPDDDMPSPDDSREARERMVDEHGTDDTIDVQDWGDAGGIVFDIGIDWGDGDKSEP